MTQGRDVAQMRCETLVALECELLYAPCIQTTAANNHCGTLVLRPAIYIALSNITRCTVVGHRWKPILFHGRGEVCRSQRSRMTDGRQNREGGCQWSVVMNGRLPNAWTIVPDISLESCSHRLFLNWTEEKIIYLSFSAMWPDITLILLRAITISITCSGRISCNNWWHKMRLFHPIQLQSISNNRGSWGVCSSPSNHFSSISDQLFTPPIVSLHFKQPRFMRSMFLSLQSFHSISNSWIDRSSLPNCLPPFQTTAVHEEYVPLPPIISLDIKQLNRSLFTPPIVSLHFKQPRFMRSMFLSLQSFHSISNSWIDRSSLPNCLPPFQTTAVHEEYVPLPPIISLDIKQLNRSLFTPQLSPFISNNRGAWGVCSSIPNLRRRQHQHLHPYRRRHYY